MSEIYNSKNEKKRGQRFFIELVLATVFSILAAGLWTDVARQIISIISKHFSGDGTNILIMTIASLLVTLIAIFCLHYLFADVPELEEAYTPSHIRS